MKRTILLGGMILALLLSLTGCTDKKERCDQIVFNMKKYGFIRHGQYQAGGLQALCVKEWDTKGNDEWRECMLSASSKAELNKCGWLEMKPDKFQ